MNNDDYRLELEYRISLFEDLDSGEGILEPLPGWDMLTASMLVGLASAAMLWWGYFS